jgi:formylglycine-generating enzyme required for sulfatase activity
VDGRRYPWGDTFDSIRCNYRLNRSTPVDGHPSGKSGFGVEDLIGNVWQMTDDVYYNGSYYFNIIRGGSYYTADSSIWYVKGGPVQVTHPEMLILVSPGFDRCATIGFRCVLDSE